MRSGSAGGTFGVSFAAILLTSHPGLRLWSQMGLTMLSLSISILQCLYAALLLPFVCSSVSLPHQPPLHGVNGSLHMGPMFSHKCNPVALPRSSATALGVDWLFGWVVDWLSGGFVFGNPSQIDLKTGGICTVICTVLHSVLHTVLHCTVLHTALHCGWLVPHGHRLCGQEGI